MIAAGADWAEDLAFAHALADRAAVVALAHFGGLVHADAKEDGTPVTAADFAVEAALVEMLTKERSEDGILSEEGARRRGAERRWILDPIDGTVNFAAGDPQWGTHVALEVDEEIVLGVITRPVERRRWWASRGGGAFTAIDDARPTRLRTSPVGALTRARITLWPPEPSPLLNALQAVGVFVPPDWSLLGRFLAGEVDAIIARTGSIWDHAPAVVLAEEAGGRFRDHRGGRRLDLRGGIYTNGRIDAALDNLLAAEGKPHRTRAQ